MPRPVPARALVQGHVGGGVAGTRPAPTLVQRFTGAAIGASPNDFVPRAFRKPDGDLHRPELQGPVAHAALGNEKIAVFSSQCFFAFCPEPVLAKHRSKKNSKNQPSVSN